MPTNPIVLLVLISMIAGTQLILITLPCEPVSNNSEKALPVVLSWHVIIGTRDEWPFMELIRIVGHLAVLMLVSADLSWASPPLHSNRGEPARFPSLVFAR